MLYYRCPAALPEQRPPELAGWVSPSEEAALNGNDVGLHRVVGICHPFLFNPTAPTAWRKLAGTKWEVAVHGELSRIAHVRMDSPWKVSAIQVGGGLWMFPAVLDPSGLRDFPVAYGEDFTPELTDVQTRAMQIATEIRGCHQTGNWPEMAIQARWAAWLLTLTYAYSVETVMMQRLLNDDVIRAACLVAGGVYGPDA